MFGDDTKDFFEKQLVATFENNTVNFKTLSTSKKLSIFVYKLRRQ